MFRSEKNICSRVSKRALMRSLPPLHDLAGMAGIDLPEYLGQVAEEAAKKGAKKDEKLEG